MSGKKIVVVIAALTMATACATPTPKNVAVPIIPTPTTTSSAASTSTSSPIPTTVPPVAVPVDLAGKSAAAVEQQLRALGFGLIRFMGPDGNSVVIDSSWIVSSVDGAGSSFSPGSVIYVRVDKPEPPPAPVAKATPKVTPKPAPPKAQQPAPPKPAPPAAAYYKNCTAAKAAGAAPVYRGQPGYGSHLDRDGDGIGCER
jgi:hypothetical protein